MTLDPKLGYVPSDRLKDAFRVRENISSQRLRDVNWNSIQFFHLFSESIIAKNLWNPYQPSKE